jgi:phenylpropionate dioxygenase-like ring-hydroxylating dioxygenase large terminal subunit
MLAARSEEVQVVGDYVVWERFGETLVIARTQLGLRAFHNVCRHRGARIVRESGRAPNGTITCPWHGFRYALDGSVRGVPLRIDFEPDALENLAAAPVRVTEWGGWVWISLATTPPDLVVYLGEIRAELDRYQMESMRIVGHERWTVAANWKTVCDGFNEAYHVPFAHRKTAEGALLVGETSLTRLPPHSMMVVPLPSTIEWLRRDCDHIRTSDCHYLVFPNTFFNCLPTHIQAFTAIPKDPVTTVLEVWMVAYEDEDSAYDERMREQWETFRDVVAEDIFVAEEAGAASASSVRFKSLVSRREMRIAWFDEEIDERISRGSPEFQNGRV